MKDYIQFNHKLCCQSTDENKTQMYKLLNNGLCGRTMLNKENFNSNIRVISDLDKTQKYASKDTFKDYNV